jgi:hypothetical protein
MPDSIDHELFEDICPACLAVSKVDGSLTSGQFCKSCSPVTYACHRCAADPQPANFGNRRKCAFLADGSFTPENWRCATIDAILNIIPSSFEHDGDDESIQGLLCEPEETRGWIILGRYKHRGCTSSAMHFGDSRAEPLTLALAEATLAYHLGSFVETTAK